MPSNTAPGPTAFSRLQRLALSDGFLHGLLIASTVCLLYLPTIHYGFVNWDDPWYVKNNSIIHHWTLSNLWDVLTETVVRNYAPLTVFAYMLQYAIWGVWAGGYHLTNMGLHAVNAILVYALIRQLSRRRDVALFAGLLFAVHPVHVESVVWVSALKGLLNAAFTLLCLIYWCRQERTGRDELKAIGFLTLALFAKTLAVVVPVIMLSYDMLIRRQKLSEAFPRQILPGLLSLWMLIKNMGAQAPMIGGVRHHLALNKLQILALDQLVLWKYAAMLVAPTHLNILYRIPFHANLPLIAVCSCASIAVASVIWRRRKSQPALAWAAVSVIALLIPVLNLFPITTLMNDRYLYLPSIAVFGVAAFGLYGFLDRLNSQRADRGSSQFVMVTLMIVSILPLAMQTIRQRDIWRSEETLWTHAISLRPEIAVVRIHRAETLHLQGQTDEAIALLTDGLETCDLDEIDQLKLTRMIRDLKDDAASKQVAGL